MDIKENAQGDKLIISSSPHILKGETTGYIMWLVVMALLPAAVFGIFAFGFYSALIVVFSIITSVLTETIICKIRKKRITIDDGSAFLTGLLIGLNMPPAVPLYIPIISSIFAIGIVKQAFGGLGQNWANPAIAARVFALIAWSKKMTTWTEPFTSVSGFDAVTAATPLGAVKSALIDAGTQASASVVSVSSFAEYIHNVFGEGPLNLLINQDYAKLFFGIKGGCIGEISVFLLIIGASFLIYKKIITLDIPLSYLLTAVILSWALGGLPFGKSLFYGDFLFHLLTGGLILGALYMATDMVTTPVTVKGRIIFGIGCGVITVLVRLFGGLPEGVSLSILFMNMLTPAINRFIKIKPMGFIKKKEA